MRKIEEILKLICNFLNERRIPYVLVGGITLSLLGTPRTTEDIDLMLKIKPREIKEFVKFLKSQHFEIDEGDFLTALREKSHYTILDKKSPFRIDIKGIYTTFDKICLESRKKVKIDELTLYAWKPEVAIVWKIYSGSEQDLKDAASIFARNYGKLDFQMLKKLAKTLKVFTQFVRFRKEMERLLK